MLVQKSVTTITNVVGRLQSWMLGKIGGIRKRRSTKSWHSVCQQLWSLAPAAALLSGFAVLVENFVKNLDKLFRPLGIITAANVALALQQVKFVGNIQCR